MALVSGRPCYKPNGGMTSTPAMTDHFNHISLGNYKVGWRKNLSDIHRKVYPIYLTINIFSLLRNSLDENLHGAQIHSCFMLIRKILSIYLFPKFPCYQLLNHMSSKSMAKKSSQAGIS